MVNYELLQGTKFSWWRISALVTFYLAATTLVFLIWSAAYDNGLKYYPKTIDVPDWWQRRAELYAKSVHDTVEISHDFRLIKNPMTRWRASNTQAATISPSAPNDEFRLVCYYSFPSPSSQHDELRLRDVNTELCTHINIGFAGVVNSTLVLPEGLERILKEEVPELKARNPNLKLLLWVGGADGADDFAGMVRNHSLRKIFLQSVKHTLRQYALHGIDLDWEFPSAYNKERQHFSQLLYEIRREYRREKRDYLLTVAVAAPEGIAYFAYDVGEINKYADFVNIMTYDYHFYSRGTPFTGLNAPLYARSNEHSILGTLNINYSVHWWISNGLDAKKLVVGLPTYGHSFTLVNPFNKIIGAPAEGFGHCGGKGFTSYSEICWFTSQNIDVVTFFDEESCSPYLSGGSEWVSYENEKSIECKTRFVKDNNLGGVMIFSLNTDDFKSVCGAQNGELTQNAAFPLITKVKKVLFNN